jgi:predicted dinucleotide-binding enzyme
MKNNRNKGISRRRFNKGALISIAGSALASIFAGTALASETVKPLKIGIVGAGKIGGSVGVLWAKAGHEILFSSRHPENLGELVEQAGPTAKAGYPKDAAEFGDVVFIAVPYHAMPRVGKDLSPLLQGKVVIDCGNPYPSRDGDMAVEALEKGTGVASAEFFPGVRLIRAYNSISHESITTQAHREGALMAIPLAGNDDEAVKVASRLIRESGFDPVFVGPLSRAREFDNRSSMYGKKGTAQELREGFGL